jgi:hypothetical protein
MTLDYIIGFCRVIASSVSTRTKAVLLNVAGPAGAPDLDNLEDDEAGERAFNQDHYTALGIIARPRPPSTVFPAQSGSEVSAEAVALRTGDGLVPIAYRDLRLHARYPAPKEGSIALVGYAGGFHSLDDVDDVPLTDPQGRPVPNKATVQTFYVPYQHNLEGVPAKAHVITIDPTPGNESISIVHGSGMAILMKAGGKNSATIKNKAGNAYVEVNDDGITANGNLVVNGGATIGSPVGALPAAIAPKLAAYLAQLETDIASAITAVGAGGAANGATGAAAFTGSAAARAALSAQIPALKTSVA